MHANDHPCCSNCHGGSRGDGSVDLRPGGIEDNVYAGRELVSVWVAEGEIPLGASGSDLEQRGLIVEKQIPAEFVPDRRMVVVPSEEIVGLVAVNNIPAEQTIVKGMFAAPAIVQTGVTDRLEERERPIPRMVAAPT